MPMMRDLLSETGVCVYKYININVFRRVDSSCVVDTMPNLLTFDP